MNKKIDFFFKFMTTYVCNVNYNTQGYYSIIYIYMAHAVLQQERHNKFKILKSFFSF